MLLLDGFSGEEEVLLNDLLAAESAENAFDVDLKATKQRLFMHAKLKLLETYLNRGKRDDFIEIYQQLFDDMKLLNGVYEKYVQYEILHAISSMLLSYMNQWGQTEEIHKNHELYRVNYNDISLNDIMMRFEKMALSLFSRKQAETYETTDRTVTLINNYIHSQLHGDLSLNKLAEVVYLNPSYLSRYYKQMTGIGISKYIEDTKIARAKEMLKQEQLKVHEIATQLGINSATNFTRFFKKATGLTPMEFRETSI
jgi:two-component system response regulator YesN